MAQTATQDFFSFKNNNCIEALVQWVELKTKRSGKNDRERQNL